MKLTGTSGLLVALLSLASFGAARLPAQQPDDRQLLQVREQVWRAWFANDTAALHKLVPPETIVMSGGEENWMHQAEVFQSAAEFQSGGGKLIRLEFPRTEVQHFGDVAIVWSNYVLETETGGKRSVSTGRASEIFVLRNGEWTNPGWHTNPTK
ncbi:MAG: nuclear transport factor 2 family protein [Terracidiphilus sp.]